MDIKKKKSLGWSDCFPMLQTRILGLSQSTEIDQRVDKKFRQGFTGTPAVAEGSENKLQFSLLTTCGGGKLVPYMG